MLLAISFGPVEPGFGLRWLKLVHYPIFYHSLLKL
jgi:hypothetical protein